MINNDSKSPSNQIQFRSVLPHEPLPVEEYGHVQIQGLLLPKEDIVGTIDNDDDNRIIAATMMPLKETIEGIELMLRRALNVDANYLPSDSPLLPLANNLNHFHNKDDTANANIVVSVKVIQEGSHSKNNNNASMPTITKARITVASPSIARTIVAFLRQHKIAPADIFHNIKNSINTSESMSTNLNINNNGQFHYSTKHMQATQITQTSLPNTNVAWPRTGMPKFRRLLVHKHMYHDANAMHKMQYDRSRTRFVFMTNIIDYDNGDGNGVNQDLIMRMKHYPHLFQDAIRRAIHSFMRPSGDTDASISNMDTNYSTEQTDTITKINLAPEIFVPSKKQLAPFKYCHIGTRSPAQAQAIIKQLQGKQIKITLDTGMDTTHTITTGKLYLDFADVTIRSAAKSNRMLSQDPSLTTEYSQQDIDKGLGLIGQSSKPECTSTTHSVVVPGLVTLKEFVTKQEEQVLLACLTGPHAPWAPVQINKSKSGHVKRRVQHYGYVFDYESADVLRNRQDIDEEGNKNGKAQCPPMPCLPDGYQGWNDAALEGFVKKAVRDGNGWDVFAAVVERVRRHSFVIEGDCDDVNEDGDGEEDGTNNGICQDDGNDGSEGGDKLSQPISIPMEVDDSVIIPSSSKRFQHLNQLTVNEYKRGQGIGAHIDTKSAFDDGLISISLGSDSVMEFRKENGSGNENEDMLMTKKLVHLPPRSLLLMSGPTRYEWSHQIVTRMTDCVDGEVIPRKTRVSLTLRTAITLPTMSTDATVKEGDRSVKINDNVVVRPMDRVEGRNFPPKWRNGTKGDDSDLVDIDISTPETERNHVHAVYDAIATQWHHTRGKRGVLWPGATRFLQQLPKGSIVADVGCGDGKYFPAIWETGSYVIGTDISEPLLQTSIGACANADDSSNGGPQNRQVSSIKMGLNSRPAVAVADCMHIPLRSKSCDAAICIAVMHHLSTSPRRIRCLEELSRIVKKGGMINIQAWALEQEEDSRRKFAGTDVFVPFNAQPRYLDKVEAESKSKRAITRCENNDNGCKGVAEMYSDAYDGAEYDERKGLVVFQRYCHMYKEGELEDLVAKIDSLEMLEGGFETGNHFVILKVVQ